MYIGQIPVPPQANQIDQVAQAPQNQQAQVVQQDQGLAQGFMNRLVELGTNLGSSASDFVSGTLTTGINAGGAIVSTAVETGANVASNLASGVVSGVNSGVALASSAVETGVNVANNVASGVVSGVNSGVALASSAVEVVSSGVSNLASGALTVGTRGVETVGGTAFATLSGILAKGVHLSGGQAATVTVFGHLPNAPGFDAASTEGAQALSARYQTARDDQNSPVAVRNVLAALDTAFTSAGGQVRNGQNLNLNLESFHAVLARGGHFVVNDNGALNDQLVQIGGTSMIGRGSSHYKGSGHAQHGMDLPNGLGHLLIGKTDAGHTFFQLESHGTGGGATTIQEKLHDLAGHTQSYLQHIGSGSAYVQLGPQGCIEGSEKDNNHVILT